MGTHPLHRPVRGLLAGLLVAVLPVTVRASSPDAVPTTEFGTALKARNGYAKAYIIPIQDVINDVTLDSITRRLDQAKKDGADLVIFDIDTPGGDAFACLQICTEIKNFSAIHTIAWVNHQAFSAGAIISLACDEIVMSPRSTLGDSQPIFFTPGGPSAVPDEIEAKVTSPLIEEVRDSARRRGYNMTLCMAMIDPTMEVFWVENSETHERRFVDRKGRDELFGIGRSTGPEKTVTHSVKPGSSADPLTGERKDVVETTTKIEPGEHIPASESKTAWRYVENDERLGPISQPIVSSRQLLTMSQDEAVAFGFATCIIADREGFRTHYDIRGPIEDLPYNWSEGLADWLGSATVRGVLLVLIILGGYVELKTPGLGLPGLVAVIALVLFLGAPYVTGLANIWEILLVIVGIILLAVELFVIPGFGVIGIIGLVLIFGGMLLSFVPSEGGPIPFHWPRFEYTLTGLRNGLLAMSISMVASLVAAIVLSKFLPRVPVLGRVVAPNPTPADVAGADPYGNLARIGDIGVTEGVLRPAGKARFGQVLVDVVTEGEYIEPDVRIEVIERHGNRVVVRACHA